MARLFHTLIALTLLQSLAHAEDVEGVQFKIRFPDSVRETPITGRVYVAISKESGRRGPIHQAGETGVPLFGMDVSQVAAGQWMVIDQTAFGHPLNSLKNLPDGDYWVQAFINVYTKCDRADGHSVYVHLDQGEGQNWRRSPGNLFSEPALISINSKNNSIELTCDQVIPPIDPPADTDYVKRIRFKSEILSTWWGQPIYLGATVLLPKGYHDHPDVHYPVNYIQGHFSSRAPAGFERDGAFSQRWRSDERQARFIYVTFQHATPYYDDSYGVNSANNGPYGDAIMEELIPAIESQFRVIQEPWARQLSGGSTGGWIAFAMQVFHPDFFGACWASAPDSPDFRSYQLVDIYRDENAYYVDQGWTRVERPARRSTDGNIQAMMKDENHYELVVGEKSRSGGQWDIWEATYGPCGDDGYPARIWDKHTGEINQEVAKHWREHFDLRYILERDWKTLGPKLQGKLHLYCGDMDNYYLNNGLRKLAAFLNEADPKFEGVIEFKPLAGHVWGPSEVELMELMEKHMRRSAPGGSDLKSWHY